MRTMSEKMSAAFNGWLTFRWAQAQLSRKVIHETRFSFFVVVVASMALVLNDQGREIAVRGGDSPWDLVTYPLATLILALQVWFWARIILGITFPRTDDNPQPMIVNVFPRLIGIVSCLIPILALAAVWRDGQAGERAPALMAMLFGTLMVFTLFVVKRRDLARRFAPKTPVGAPAGPDSHHSGFGKSFMRFSLVQVVALTLWAWFAPRSLGSTLGAAPTLLLGLASFVPTGSYLVLRAHGTTFPAVTALILSGVLLSSCDPHFMRELAVVRSDTRPTIATEFARWQSAAPRLDDRPTMVVVAAAGGGITAAYWTATVLTELRSIDPQFASRLFSVSSVSGGSVGAVTFAQALACPQASVDPRFATRVRDALHGDLLAPTLGTALFNDVMFWFPPQSVLAHYEVKFPDRAVTFERQLETQWKHSFPECTGLDASFLRQRAATSWLPILLLNSTHEETGRPVIQSHVRLAADAVPQPFESAIDFFAVARRDLRLSTAALNSARFPFVSPAGRIRHGRAAPEALRLGHLIDGGYFENDGAFGTLKLLESLRVELAGVRVIVIQISIDAPGPYEPPHRTRDESYLADRVAHQPHAANELLAPLYGFIATRDAHQSAARDALRTWAEMRGEDGLYVHFRALIPRQTEAVPNPARPPLGWLLSDKSERQLRERTMCLDRNFEEWKRLAAALHLPPDGVAPCGPSEPLHRDIDRGLPP